MDAVREEQAGIAVLEGVMGYYDGLGGISQKASTYDVARATRTPAILIVNGKGVSASLAAQIQGFQNFKADSGIAGVILGAASLRRPVVVDGFISSAGALIAAAIEPDSRDYMILAHGSAEPGHIVMAKLLDKKPLLDLSMRLGEGTGAALAMNLLDAASAIMNRMATFESAKVTTEGIR